VTRAALLRRCEEAQGSARRCKEAQGGARRCRVAQEGKSWQKELQRRHGMDARTRMGVKFAQETREGGAEAEWEES